MTTSKHRWGAPFRPNSNNTDRTCVACGVLQRTRKEPPKFWHEYWRDGVKLDVRPDCTSVIDQDLERAA